MYELWIKKKDGIWHLADLGNDNPVINFSANDLAQLRSTNNNYSQRLNLPLSPTNAEIFEHVDVFDVLTDTPYRLFDCRLHRNGCTIAGKGAKLSLDRISSNYECQIVSGNFDLFQTLGKLKASELKLGYFTRGHKGMDPNSFTKFYTYALASFAFGGVDSITNKLDQGLTFPFAPLKPIIEEILKNQDFKLITNLKDEDWTNKAISICSLEDDGEELKANKGMANSHLEGWYVAGWGSLPIDIEENGSSSLEYVHSGFITGVAYTAKFQMKLIINLKLDSRATGIFVSLMKGSEYLIEYTRYAQINESLEIDLLAGESVTLFLYYVYRPEIGAPDTNYYDYDLSIQFTPTISGEIPVGGKVNISKNLGFDRQLDLFNAFAQLYGLTISVDNVKRIVYAYTFDKIIENKKIARDWSDKLDVKKRPEQEFSFGNYAQHNKISLIDNDRDFVQDFAIFQVRNESRQDQKDLFSIKFEAGKNLMMEIQGANTSKIFANIPLVENNFENGKITKSQFKKGKPHLVELSSETIQVVVDDKNYQYKIAHHPRVRQFINQYYSALVNNVLYQSKVITAYFLLTEQDIEEFDQYIPVYVDYFGYYFYVNKIVNYGAGYLTECELIKI